MAEDSLKDFQILGDNELMEINWTFYGISLAERKIKTSVENIDLALFTSFYFS